MTIARFLAALGVVATASGLGGCCPPRPETFVSAEQLVGEYNANARRVPRLWCRAKIEARIATDRGTLPWGSLLAPPNGYLLLGKGPDPLGPHDFVLIGKEAGTRMEVFRLGNSLEDGAYYFWYAAGDRRGGAYGRPGRAAPPGAKTMAVDPLQLLSVLGICELPADLNQVATRMDESDCHNRAYVLTYVDRLPGGPGAFRREVYFRWDDRERRRPFRVDFFDQQGQRPVMTARMDRYGRIEMADVNDRGTRTPMMPTKIDIHWPKTGGRLRIRLSEATTADKVDPDVYRLWERLPSGMDRSALTSLDAPPPRKRPGR